MKTLQALFEMDCKIAIYVPSTVDVDCPCDSTDMIEHVIGTLSELFGGATATRAKGCWKDTSNGKLIYEDITIVYSYCTSSKARCFLEEVIALCEHVRDEMRQQAVTLEYNNQIAFI